MNDDLDKKYFYPEVFQAVADNNYNVYAYINDGSIRKFDAKPLIDKGGIFEPLKNKDVFKNTLTVIGNTVAWDLIGNRDEYRCIDVDPFLVFESPVVKDIPIINERTA